MKNCKKEKCQDEIQRCPQCKLHNLLRDQQDFICLECDWNSAESAVANGGLDELFYAYECSLIEPPAEVSRKSTDTDVEPTRCIA